MILKLMFSILALLTFEPVSADGCEDSDNSHEVLACESPSGLFQFKYKSLKGKVEVESLTFGNHDLNISKIEVNRDNQTLNILDAIAPKPSLEAKTLTAFKFYVKPHQETVTVYSAMSTA